jgi:hypothetical protein
MHHFRRLLTLSLTFWIPLGILGAGLWLMSGWFTAQVYSQTTPPAERIDTTSLEQITLSFSVTILSIDADIDRRSRSTEVDIRTAGSSLQELEFEYPFISYSEIEQAIAQDTGLTAEQIRSLIRYRIE